MGRKKIVSQVKKQLTAAYIGAVILSLGAAFLVFIMIVAKDWSILPIAMVPAIAGAGFIIMILAWTKNPEKYCPHVKQDLRLMEKAEALYNKVIYEDKYIIVSDYVIGSKKNPFHMVYRNEVLVECPGVHHRSDFASAESIILYSAYNTAYIYTRGADKNELTNLFAKIDELCPLSKLLIRFDRTFIENAITRYHELKAEGVAPTKEMIFNEA